jgi:hypothetical protein
MEHTSRRELILRVIEGFALLFFTFCCIATPKLQKTYVTMAISGAVFGLCFGFSERKKLFSVVVPAGLILWAGSRLIAGALWYVLQRGN